MAKGTVKSKWVETEVERSGLVYLIPFRCRLEARSNRIRTVLQSYCLDKHRWGESQKGQWFNSQGASNLSQAQLDEAACSVADTMCAKFETGPLHSDWVIEALQSSA